MQDLDAQRIKDEEHLKLLGVFNYVFAGLLLFGTLMVVPQIFMMRSGAFQEAIEQARTDALERHGGEVSAPPEVFDHVETFFTVFLTVWIIISLIGAVLSFLSGRSLRQQRNRGLSYVVAALQCIVVPLGTVLGIFTFVVLGRATVQKLYNRGSP